MKSDNIIEVVELLNNKIKVLEALLKCKDSEIDILKSCLKEIGAQINVDDIREPNFADSLNPFAIVEYRRTNLFLQKTYTYCRKDDMLLEKINDALNRIR